MQDILAITIVAVAAGYMVRKVWLRLTKRGGACGSCSSCDSEDSIKTRPLVNISLDVSRQ